jgi:hypothetical protein
LVIHSEAVVLPVSELWLQETIGKLKEKVQEISNIAAVRQRLIFKGKEVHNHVELSAAGTLRCFYST